MLSNSSVAVCTPCLNYVDAEFAIDLANLCGYLGRQNISYGVYIRSGSMLPTQRTKLAEISEHADYVLWLDSDMRFPITIYYDLVKHDKDIVACNYLTRDGKNNTTSFIKNKDIITRLSLTQREKLVQVDFCGMGVMLVKKAVFDRIPKPWFDIIWNPDSQTYSGEDIYFCQKAADYGFEIWIDTETSKEVKHIGKIEYDIHNLR